MKSKFSILMSSILLSSACWTSCGSTKGDIAGSLGVQWTILAPTQGLTNPPSKIILENKSNTELNLADYSLWFNFMQGIDPAKMDARFQLQHRNGDLFQISFADQGLKIPAKDTIEIHFTTRGPLVNYTDGPAGFYLRHNTDETKFFDLEDYKYVELPLTAEAARLKLEEQYIDNQRVQKTEEQLFIPSVKSLSRQEGAIPLNQIKGFRNPGNFDHQIFQKNFKDVFNLNIALTSNENEATVELSKDSSLAAEAYRLKIDAKGIHIAASSETGIFYALQSLQSLVPADLQSNYQLPFVEVYDEPRYEYRGLSLDVSRNFRDKESIFRVLDGMARYKLNKLHFHFIDDEGWRLEIPSLPELTEVGSRRGAGYLDNSMLQPSYNSGVQPLEKQYYSTDDFIAILKYAAERHIQVIPEIETPGHARAAIKAMEYRYDKYMAQGDKKAALAYRLAEPEDKSIYNSAQNWNDNVMNPALPATYTFLETVIKDVKELYKKANIPFYKVSLGGDETPAGSWEKSPAVQRLMDSLSFKTAYEAWPYYIDKINKICIAQGLEMAGWEEMGMHNLGKGMVVNPSPKLYNIQLDVWNNTIGGGQEDLAYQLANAGYKVVFTSASNLYFDFTWKGTFEEPGHWWASRTSIFKTYSFIPENYYLNIFQNARGENLKEGFFKNKVNLTAEGRKNLIGIKGAIWSEKIRSQDRLDYMLFPRLLALAERAWSPEKDWEKGSSFNQQAFMADYSAFMQKLGKSELPKIEDYTYRLPFLGAQVQGNQIVCNVEYPGFQIYYTVDGQEPTLTSKAYTAPIDIEKGKTYKFKVINAKGRGGYTETLSL